MMPQSILFSLLIGVATLVIASARPEPLPMFLVNRSISKTIEVRKDTNEVPASSNTATGETALKDPLPSKDNIIQDSTSSKLMDSVENIPVEPTSDDDSNDTKKETSPTDTNDVINLETKSTNDSESNLEVNDGIGHPHGKVTKANKKKVPNKKEHKPIKKAAKPHKSYRTTHLDSIIDALIDSLLVANDDFEDIFDAPRGLPRFNFDF